MGFLDNIVAAFSPEAAYRRMAFRQAYEEMKSAYDAGSYDKGNRNWRVSNNSAEYTDRYSRDDVRARARDLERNSDIMNSVVGAFKRNIVGGGSHVQVKTEDEELNKKIYEFSDHAQRDAKGVIELVNKKINQTINEVVVD